MNLAINTPLDALSVAAFAILGGGALLGALFTITRRNPVTAVMSLVGTFVALAGLYATLSAHFLAVMQVTVYAGAIMVLFIFVVMILNREEIAPIALRSIFWRMLGVVGAAYVVALLARVVWIGRDSGPLRAPAGPAAADFGTTKGVGLSLFQDFLFPFEAISLLLLVAIVGGVLVSRSREQEQQAEDRIRYLEELRARDAHGHGAHDAAHGHPAAHDPGGAHS